MTARQLEICQLLKDLAKSPEQIAIQSQLPVESVRRWLRLGAGRACQLSLFDFEQVPEPLTTKPSTTASDRGLSLFSRVD